MPSLSASPVRALLSEPSLKMLTVILGSLVAGNHGLASVAGAVTSLLLVLCLVWGFPFPGPAGELECACMGLRCSLNPDERCVVLASDAASGDSSQR